MEAAVMPASSRSRMAEVVEKFENERRKATKAVVLQEKVFEENFVLLIDLEEQGKWENIMHK